MNEQQIDKEVEIRVLRETTNSKFASMQKNFDDKFELIMKNFDDKFAANKIEFDLKMKNFDDKLDNRFKSLWSIGIVIMGLLTPVFLKSIGVL